MILGAGILTLPRSTADEVGSADGWISVILGGLISMIAGVIISKLSQQFPQKTLFEYSEEIVGKWIGGIISLLLISHLTLLAGFEVRAMAEVVNLFLLYLTPVEVTIIVMMSVGVYLIVGGVNSIARLFEILLPPTVIIFFLVFLMSFKIFELDHLRPVLGQGIMPVFKGVKTTLLSFTGFEVMLILIAFMREPHKAVRSVIIGIGMPILFYVMTLIIVYGGISAEESITETFPTVTLVRTFELEGIIFERFESFLFAIWILQIFTTFSLSHYVASLGLAHLFKKKIYPFIYVLLPIMYIIAMYPENINELFKLGDVLGYTFLVLAFGIPSILWVIAKMRGKLKGKGVNQK